MRPADFFETLKLDKTPVEALGFNPYYRPLQGWQAGRRMVGGEYYFDLASNDYLGLAGDERIHQAMAAAIREYGSSMCGTPIATGYAQALADLEEALARFVGLEAALVFPSCYQANVALFPAIARPQDVILVDHYAHASLAQGIKAVGCKVKPFLHNDPAHLEKLLAAGAGFRQTFVVTESVFSTEGSVAPLGAIGGLCHRYEAIPVVDDSHGLGVLGRTGRGILEHHGISQYPGLYTASLGKALANVGGMIAGNRKLIEYLRYSCPGLIYSTALPPACIGGIRCAIDIIAREFGRLGTVLRRNQQQLCEKLRGGGFDMPAGASPIAAIQRGSSENTVRLARAFFEHRVLGTPFLPPSVPPGRGVLRLIVGAKLDSAGMEALLDALDGVVAGAGV